MYGTAAARGAHAAIHAALVARRHRLEDVSADLCADAVGNFYKHCTAPGTTALRM